ncbi:MAG: hypothetical protein AAFZ65_12620 [Planctomycetota bacterium]
MKRRQQELDPSPPLERRTDAIVPSAARRLTLETFEAQPGEKPTAPGTTSPSAETWSTVLVGA